MTTPPKRTRRQPTATVVVVVVVVGALIMLLEAYQIVVMMQLNVLAEHNPSDGLLKSPQYNNTISWSHFESIGRTTSFDDLLAMYEVLKNATTARNNNTANTNKGSSSLQLRRPQGLRIVMMGDSLTRFQYLDLAYFLKFGTFWIQDHDNYHNITNTTAAAAAAAAATNHHPYRDFSVVTHGGVFASWLDFYQSTRAMLDPEQCDCYRQDRTGRFQQHWAKGIIENRYYNDMDNNHNNSLVYLQKFGVHHPFRSNWKVKEIHNASARRHQGWMQSAREIRPAFTGQWVDTIRDFVAHLDPKPNVFIFNQGLWPHDDLENNETLQDDIVATLKALNIVSIYKTTTKSQRANNSNAPKTSPAAYEESLCRKTDYCLNMSWTGFLPREYYRDRAHFLPPIYTWMNLQLLHLLDTTIHPVI